MKFAASCSIHQDKLMQPCTRWAPISLQKRTNAGYGLKIIGYWGDLAARASVMIFWIFALSILIAPRVACAATWQATVGSQSTDKGIQALAFLPNELWIHAGDSITWTFPSHEIHTVTFLQQDTDPQQLRPNRPGAPGGGCPGTTASPSSFDGSTCVTSGDDLFVDGATYTVTFPTAGNFKLVCLVHNNMTGVVHVLASKEKLPHKQAFYDDQAHKRQTELLSDGAGLEDQATATEQEREGEHQQGSEKSQGSKDAVTVGIGEIVATGGGSDTVSVMRFLQGSIYVRVGDTVAWTNLDPVTPHTVTFGFPIEPAPPQPPAPAGVVTLDSDGARHADVNSPTEDVHSGFLVAALQDRGPPPPPAASPPPPAFAPLPQSPLTVTRFRVTFTKPGIFNYRCILHDDLGMTGQVIVRR
jgi:plastocyanin